LDTSRVSSRILLNVPVILIEKRTPKASLLLASDDLFCCDFDIVLQSVALYLKISLATFPFLNPKKFTIPQTLYVPKQRNSNA
jgi:hypothetical protein